MTQYHTHYKPATQRVLVSQSLTDFHTCPPSLPLSHPSLTLSPTRPEHSLTAGLSDTPWWQQNTANIIVQYQHSNIVRVSSGSYHLNSPWKKYWLVYSILLGLVRSNKVQIIRNINNICIVAILKISVILWYQTGQQRTARLKNPSTHCRNIFCH